MTGTLHAHDSMHQASPSLTRKRRRSDGDRADEGHKKRHTDLPPAAFWDNLSQIWLTRRALKEFDRRNRQRDLGTAQGSEREQPVTPNCQTNKCSVQSNFRQLGFREAETSKAIKAFAKHGGPDLSDLRNHSEPLYRRMESSQSRQNQRRVSESGARPTAPTTKTKTTGTYDRHFKQHLIDHGIFTSEYEYSDGSVPAEPTNWDEIQRRLARPRPSLSPSRFSDGQFKQFKRAAARATKEKQVTESVVPFIEGSVSIKCRGGGIPFTNFAPLTDGTLKPNNPDFFYGAQPEQLDKRIRQELGDRVQPSTQGDLLIVPNFFLEVKGPDGAPAVAERQACYDGALGARAIHSLRSYKQDEPIYDNKAYTIASTYQTGVLKVYTTHPIEPNSSREHPEYHMQAMGAWCLDHTRENFREGVTAYRNARDWAQEQRDVAIAEANERLRVAPRPVGVSPDIRPNITSEDSASRTYEDPVVQASSRSTDQTEIRTDTVIDIEMFDRETTKRRYSERQRSVRKRRV